MQHEPLIRLTFFLGVLVLMAIWEAVAPRRVLAVKRPWRWASNLTLVAVNSLVVRFAFTLGALRVAVVAAVATPTRLPWLPS